MSEDFFEELSGLLPNNEPATILAEGKRIFGFHYPQGAFDNIKQCASMIEKLFAGEFPGYLACSTVYHDISHVYEVFLASVRLLDGYNLTVEVLPQQLAENLLIGALFHDVGYIQQSSKDSGTGARYTAMHVDRGILFLKKYYERFFVAQDQVESIARMIKATELSSDFSIIRFRSDDEKKGAAMLGAADLFGPMADRSYLERLIFLYREFQEANMPGYNTEFDILRKTADFYELTQKRLAGDFENIDRVVQAHFRDRHNIDKNLYIEAVNRNIDYLVNIIDDETTNFRKKLKRWDSVKKE